MHQESNQTDRRSFLGASAAAAAGVAAASQLSIARAAKVAGSDEIRIGLVGCGGRGTGALQQLFEAQGPVKLVAMGDAFEYRLSGSHKQLTAAAGKKADELGKSASDLMDVPKDRQFIGLDAYKQVMDADCHLVVLATPPGFRPAQFEAAIEAGKHVFMEKPVATDAPGIRKVLEVGEKAKQKNLAVAVGLQRHHEPSYIETIKRLQDGAIGDIVLTRVYWNNDGLWVRPRKTGQTEMEYQTDNWFYFTWCGGDNIVEQHIHNIDVSNWLMGTHPVEANGMGGRQVRTSKDTGQVYDHHFVEFTYGDTPYGNGATMMSQCRHIPGTWNQVGEFAHGTKGTANIARAMIYGADGKPAWRYRGPGVSGHQQEQLDLITSLRNGDIPNEVEQGAHSTMTAIMGRMATYGGKVVKWDDALNSTLSLGPKTLAWDAEAPVQPDADGRYPVAIPGKTVVL
ncbi:Inositol 2-dehydrogenase [Pirellulimonas nuda]|uniref:Inositol 2-dehydrogenase n=1 Tax=Pirellulimonas nuda TaxID=2528009 RepID=A0A518DGJ3_9BACT|nr:Gfo/Idh/MocA family oxidoreductase [Pirellulimonas nuda]QDU90596.1 Inositol 2-dehydrogenase [Pirellulimonas nuda]